MSVIKWKNIYWRGPGNSIAETTLFDSKEEALRDSTQGFLEYRDTLAVHVEACMFEVGKKYGRVGYPNEPLATVLAKTSDGRWIAERSLNAPFVMVADDKWFEIKEPKTIVRYVNVYPFGQVSQPYRTRRDADFGVGQSRVACKRVEITYTEGEMDP